MVGGANDPANNEASLRSDLVMTGTPPSSSPLGPTHAKYEHPQARTFSPGRNVFPHRPFLSLFLKPPQQTRRRFPCSNVMWAHILWAPNGALFLTATNHPDRHKPTADYTTHTRATPILGRSVPPCLNETGAKKPHVGASRGLCFKRSRRRVCHVPGPAQRAAAHLG